MDYGHKQTDAMLKKMEKRIQKVYAQAAKDTERKVSEFYSGYEKRYAAKLAEMKAGEITAKEFAKWNHNQIMTGKRWEEMRDTIATDLTNTDKLAVSMINGYLPEVYALNHNFGTYEIEKGLKLDTSYTLYDRQTVERLIKKNPHLIPSPKLDENKDFRWNKSRFNSGITQGILQGESLDKIARRVALGTSDSDYKAAIRNARTATTGAQNAGRLDSYERADEMGIKIKKVWMATLDNHTRDSHALLDGEKVDYDEPFSNGLMYPGDLEADDPSEVWNCRCTMVADVDKKTDLSDLWIRNNRLGDMSYDDWKKAHKKKSKEK